MLITRRGDDGERRRLTTTEKRVGEGQVRVQPEA